MVKRYPRSSYTITDKLSLFMIRDEKEIPGFFEEQLKRLGVDYIDYYWLHGLDEPTYHQAEAMHAFEFIQEKKRVAIAWMTVQEILPSRIILLFIII